MPTVVGPCFSIVADAMLARGVDRARIRVGYQAAALLAPGVLLLFATTGGALQAFVVFTVVSALCSLAGGGIFAAYLEVAPSWSGQVLAIGNTVGSLAAVVSPYVVQALTAAYGARRGYVAAFCASGLGAGVPATLLFALLYRPARIERLQQQLRAWAGEGEGEPCGSSGA